MTKIKVKCNEQKYFIGIFDNAHFGCFFFSKLEKILMYLIQSFKIKKITLCRLSESDFQTKNFI